MFYKLILHFQTYLFLLKLLSTLLILLLFFLISIITSLSISQSFLLSVLAYYNLSYYHHVCTFYTYENSDIISESILFFLQLYSHHTRVPLSVIPLSILVCKKGNGYSHSLLNIKLIPFSLCLQK